MNKPKILVWDVESTPVDAVLFNSGKQYVSHDKLMSHTKIICIGYKYLGEPMSKTKHLVWDKDQNDKAMVAKFSEIVNDADAMLTHNGDGFDLPLLNARVLYHGLPPIAFPLSIDTCKLSRRAFRLPSHSLAFLSRYLQLGKKMDTGGFELWWQVWKENDKKALTKMVKYCMQDVKLLEKVFKRMRPYIKTVFNLAVFLGDSRLCPNCGGKLNVHDTRVVTMLRQVTRLKCKKCLHIFNSGVNLTQDTKQYAR